MENKFLLSRLLFVFTFVSCVACDVSLNRAEYQRWVTDYENELRVAATSGEFMFDLQFQPTEYVWLQRAESVMDTSELARELKELATMQYYTLTIANTSRIDPVSFNANSETEKQQRQYYFSYMLQEDITLIENGQTLPCVLYHFERPNSQNGGRRIVLGFANEAPTEKSTLVIDSELFGSLPVHITVKKTNLPTVKL